DHLADLADPLARALCWTAAIDQLRDAELAARDYVRLVVNNIHTETDPGAVQQLLGGAAQAITLYGDPANRDAARLQLAMRALESLKAAEPGSDLQLVWARAFISNARIVDAPHTPLATIRSLIANFGRFDQAELIEPYRRGYFDSIEAMWNSRPVEVAVTVVDGMYPLALMSPDLIAETDAYLEAHTDAAPPIRRYLIENRSEERRVGKAG